MQAQEKRKIINEFMEEGFLVNPSFFDNSVENFSELKDKLKGSGAFILNGDVFKILNNSNNPNWSEIERLWGIFEKQGNKKPYETMLKCLLEPAEEKEYQKEGVKILFNYNKEILKKSVNNFVSYFNNRYKSIENILKARQELSNLTSIGRVLAKNERDTVSVIGLVTEKTVTNNNNIILTVEDLSGQINVLVSKNNPELYELAKDLVEDEVIGVKGVSGDKIIFSNGIVFPDIPLQKEIKKSPEEVYAIFLSDLHVGSNTFLEEKFEKFLNWINGKAGNEKQRELTRKIKYVFIAGDLVDGVGIYPGQDEELNIKDIYEQYRKCAELLSKIPQHINIIVCPGNHDASRLSEPQPPLFKDFSEPLTSLPNLIMVSNPSVINIASTQQFPGFDVLLYHGYSFDFYVANVDSIRNSGGYDRADLIMKFLLQRRHLAPSHSSTLYVPDSEEDALVVKNVPDFFVSGHIHKVAVSSYRGVSLVCGSCWQSMTSFQEKMGHHPEPARVPLVNLKTRDTKILRF
ncbi:MAG: DNA-directed DNA polymerase II small subunit [Candidatus Nanoarchaeia archaeon]